MLKVQDISKKYVTGGLVQQALNGVSLSLRDNEFVSILGPSGSGKTTLLNVIGGLDRYDSGDLIINGVSTKQYTDKDWDAYRNNTIGFVFQSYNLIPHQTVLANTELALTISGVSRRERRRRAKEALEAVGLGNQTHKKPNQMSGGQMQRVAIARALVNDPDILLADEPTGALDTETSVQIMELLKKVADDRLVVMVTHNPELAEQYSTRIVKLKDGKIIEDSDPFEPEDSGETVEKSMGKAHMSFFTSLALSFNNLLTKKARTLLTSLAGSIGIIGIALILAISTGFQNYIDKMQEDTLSTYPLTIESESADMTSMLTAMADTSSSESEEGEVSERQVMTKMFAQIGTNDLGAFKKHIEDNYDEIKDSVSSIQYGYGISPRVFLTDTSDGVRQINPSRIFSGMGMGDGSMMMGSSMMGGSTFVEMIDNRELLQSQYDVLAGRWPESWDELIIVLYDSGTISDYLVYSLGLRDPQELSDMISKVTQGESVENVSEPLNWSYEELLELDYTLIDPSEMYQYNNDFEVWEDMSEDEEYMKKLIGSSEKLRVVGVIAPKPEASATAMTSGVAYTGDLTRHIIEKASESELVKKQLADMDTDVFSGSGFDEDDGEGMDFSNILSVDAGMLSSAFAVNIDQGTIDNMLGKLVNDGVTSVSGDIQGAQRDFESVLTQLCTGMLTDYVNKNAGPDGRAQLDPQRAESVADEYLAKSQPAKLIANLETKYQLPAGTLQQVYRPLLIGQIASAAAENISVVPQDRPSGGDMPEPSETSETTAETEPSTPQTEPSAPETEPTDPVTEPTDPVTEPTDPSTDPTDPTDPETDPTDPETEPTLPTMPDLPQVEAGITLADIPKLVSEYVSGAVVKGAGTVMAAQMSRSAVEQELARQMANVGAQATGMLASMLKVDPSKIAGAFKFNFDEEQMTRLMTSFASSARSRSAQSNLSSLGYADLALPSSISVYLSDFDGKQKFLSFIDDYNDEMEESGNDEQVITYTDLTGVLISSVKTIVDSVSYVLIAFVAVSLVVSSIMIGIITHISVLERTKEIGILRALGASKRNISQVFNAETFIIGMCSGALGVIISSLMTIPINAILRSLLEADMVRAVLPVSSAAVLVLISVGITVLGGLIPAKNAAKKDPVIALRSE